jgi:3-dehydroquinate dehydratase-1
VEKIHEHNMQVIMSNHDFQSTPSEDELIARMRLMHSSGGDVLKIAVMPSSPKDVLTLLSATNEMALEISKPLVTMSMGKLGVISRIAGEIFNSCLTFGTVGKGSAPGQIPIDQLKQCLEIIHNSQSMSQ